MLWLQDVDWIRSQLRVENPKCRYGGVYIVSGGGGESQNRELVLAQLEVGVKSILPTQGLQLDDSGWSQHLRKSKTSPILWNSITGSAPRDWEIPEWKPLSVASEVKEPETWGRQGRLVNMPLCLFHIRIADQRHRSDDLKHPTLSGPVARSWKNKNFRLIKGKLNMMQ